MSPKPDEECDEAAKAGKDDFDCNVTTQVFTFDDKKVAKKFCDEVIDKVESCDVKVAIVNGKPTNMVTVEARYKYYTLLRKKYDEVVKERSASWLKSESVSATTRRKYTFESKEKSVEFCKRVSETIPKAKVLAGDDLVDVDACNTDTYVEMYTEGSGEKAKKKTRHQYVSFVMAKKDSFEVVDLIYDEVKSNREG